MKAGPRGPWRRADRTQPQGEGAPDDAPRGLCPDYGPGSDPRPPDFFFFFF